MTCLISCYEDFCLVSIPMEKGSQLFVCWQKDASPSGNLTQQQTKSWFFIPMMSLVSKEILVWPNGTSINPLVSHRFPHSMAIFERYTNHINHVQDPKCQFCTLNIFHLEVTQIMFKQTHISDWWFGTWDFFSIYWGFQRPNWRTHIFQRGFVNHQPDP